ncbi:MAG: hypothetical protein EKK64_04145 [Neisseriaceae bacterium]|jgi:hypothetical protein|nr:MAG: hypothetical protein EKK64_04145 [Neisseriaceae bacterium]
MLVSNNELLLVQDLLQDSILTLSLAVLIIILSQVYKKSFFVTLIFFVALLSLVNLVPIYRGSSLVQFVRGGIGDVSVASGVLLIMLVYRLFGMRNSLELFTFFERLLVVVLGGVLYLSAFGFISLDVYSFGYIENAFSLSAFVAIIFVLLILNLTLGYVWLIAFIGYYFHLLESHNLWDYMFDPIFWMVMLSVFITKYTSILIYKNKKARD